MKLSDYLKQNGMTSKEYFDMQKRKSKGKTTLTDYRKNQEISLKNKIGLDTFDSDLKALGANVESIYNGWQDQDTMNNTKANIVTMQERLNAYQEYAKLFGGEDVTELASGYQAILDDWDNRAATYSKFKTAEDYTKAAEREKSLPTADLDAVDAEIKDLEAQIEAKHKPMDYNNLAPFTTSSRSESLAPTNPYNLGITNEEKSTPHLTGDSAKTYTTLEKLENELADKKAYYEDAKTTQETLATIQKETAMASDPNNMEGYNQYIASYDAERASEDAARARDRELFDNMPWWAQLLSAAGTNNPDTTLGGAELGNVVRAKMEDKSWQRPQGEWTDDEKRVLGGYFREDRQKAIDYVVKKNNEKAKAEQGKTEKAIQDSATSNVGMGALHTVGAIASAPFGLADYLDDVTDKVAGRPIIEESFVTPFEYSQAVTSGVTTHLNEKSGTLNENIPVIGGKGLGDVYGLGTSVLQSAASAYTLGGAGTLISYFGQGAAAGVDDALSRGATDEQALSYGLVLGAAEGVSEMIGADKLLKLGSPNEIRKILVNGFKKGGGKAFWSLIDKQGKAEAIEEMFSGIAGQVADNFILKGKSNFDALTREYRAMGMSAVEAQKKAWMQSIGDVAYDTLSGYISGAVHAGPQIVASAHKQNAENKTIGKEIRGNERVTDMLNIASLSPQESDALAAYNEYAKQGVNAENITDAQLGNLYGMAEADAVSSVMSKKTTKEQKADAETTYNRLSKMKTENKEAKVAKALSQADEEGVVTPVTREMVINEQAKGMSEAEANLFRLVDDGHSNAADYADSFNLVVAMAQNGYDQDYILEHRGVLSTGQVNSIYQSVVTNPKMAQQKRLDALIQEQGDNLEIKGTIDDSVIDYGNTGAKGKVNWSDLHPNVKATIAYVSGFSTKVAGMDVQLVTNGRDYGFTGQYDRQGNTMLVDITALTERVKSADTKGRKDNARFIVSTVAHEVTHWMEEKAPELYQQYDKMVMDALTAGVRSEADVLARRRALLEKAEAKRAKNENRKPREITDKEVRREVIARASEDMLALSEEGKKFFESLSESEQKQFVDKIKEVIQNIKDWIKSVLSTLKSDAPEAVELRLLAKDLDAISKKWDEMLRQAAKSNAAMKKAGVNDKAIMESKASDETQMADIDTYTAAQYNNFGWVAVNKVLTGKELKKLYTQFAKVKLNKEYNFKNELGEYLIPVGEKYGSIDNLVYIKGTNKHPIIRQVVEIKKEYRENAESIVMEVMDDEAKGLCYDAFEVYEAYAGAEVFNVHKVLDYPSYSELRKTGAGGRYGRGTYSNDREGDNGTRVSGTRTGEVRSNDVEVSYSDIDADGYAPTFYSYMGKTINEIKQDKIGANSVVAYLKGKGVKDEEIKWSGIEAWLDGKKSVTKTELQEFVAGSMLQIEESESIALDWEVVYDDEGNYKISDKATGNIIDEWVYDAALEDGLGGYVNNNGDVALDVREIEKILHRDQKYPRWNEYKLNGGSNYRELTFKLPNSTYSNSAMRTHWGNDAEGILASARIQDFDVNGQKMLFIEEIQSDWHNEGHKKGYREKGDKTIEEIGDESARAYREFYETVEGFIVRSGESANPALLANLFYGEKDAYDFLRENYTISEEQMRYIDSEVAKETNRRMETENAPSHESAPDAPFRNNYHEYVLKRLIRMAVEEGYDSIGWTTADIQSERWSDEYAEGYRIEYDQDIPKFLRKYGKKWGATVGKTKINTKQLSMEEDIDNAFIDDMLTDAERQRESGTYSVWSMPITDSMKDSVMHEGQVMYSDIDEDSEGNKLTAEQKEYFKNSTIRDEQGKLKVMYHGTPNAGFTKFRSGTYFTEHKWYAERYKERSASSLSYKKTADNPDVYAVYLNIQKPFDTRNPEEARVFNEEYLGHYGMGTPLMESGLPDWLDGVDLQEFLEEQGYDYDGLILDEGSVGGYGDEVVSRGISYVVFNPEQVKNIDNRTPTANPDIRYSDIDELDDLNAQLKEKHNQVYSASMELKKFDAKAAEDKLYAVLQKDGASKQELDDALQEYAKWGEESGYADASAKLSALKDEEKLLRREIQKVEDRLHDELKERIAHWSDEDVKKYVSKAVRKYHTTTRLDKASYLVTTGSMLDFSDGQGYRVKDHREISEILDLPDYAEYSDGMIAFMNMGNIRLQTYGIDVSAMPNAKQFATLRDVIFTVMRENDEFSVDFSKTDGYSAGSVTYGKGTSASKIIADIKSYFETGVVPEEQSSIRDFLYSDIDAEVDIYEVLGENKRLNKENKTIREDVERLKERLKLERQITHGNRFNENQLDAVAGHIRNLGNSNYSKPELINKLRDVYTYIATSKEVTWDDLFARMYGIAEDVLSVARPVYSPNDYYANIYRDLRSTEISLSKEQKKYVKDMLGVDWHKAFFGKIKVSDKGIPLNSKWQEWAGKYPNEFTETQDLNQALELLEIYETAKELKEVVEEYNVVEQTRWLANEIYNQYWNVSPIRTTADKYDQQIKHLNSEHRRAMKELRDGYNERLEKQKQYDRAERSRIFKKLREDHIKELQEIRRTGKERMDKYKEEAARKTRIHSITANSLTLNEWLVKNSKDKHIHESMKGPVVTLLQAIDFSSKRALGMWGGDMSGVPTNKDISLQKALSQVQQMMKDASVGKEELVMLYGHELDDDIAAMVESVDNIMRTVGDNEFILNKMTLDDLITLDNVVKTIKHAVTQMNKFHIVNHAKGIANLAQEEIVYAEKLGKANVYTDKSLKAGVRKLLAWKNINPYYAFKRFGIAGKKVFEAFQDGYDKFAFNIKEIIDFTNSTYEAKEVQEWEKEIKSFKLRMPVTENELSNPDYEPQYQEVQMTVAQIMDLYLLNKREAARAHLLGGGIRVADIETKGGKVIAQAEGAILEQQEIAEIIKSLTPRQIEVADALSHFMNTTTTDWGNEVSMARFGYKAFGEKNYVPMQADKNNLAVDDETEKNNSLFRLLNMSFTKGLTEGANNRLVVSSIFDVFAQHTSDMAKYNALALPVLDAFRWYNYKEKGFKGETAFVTKSVKQAIENAFGKDGQSYITTFLKDLNGQENTSRDTVGRGFFTKAKIAAVGANIRVALLQPTAYLKASANIDNKYLVKALLHKPKIGRAEKYCGMALWKSLGYFDTNVQRGVADQIKHAETKYDKAVELSMKGAEWGDKITFGYLWNAAELEIREKRQDLKVGSDEFYFEVGKRLRDIIYSTQVVDSVMTRSEMMRSPDWGDKLLTTFASEPTIAYNMLADAYLQTQLDARELGSKKAAIKKNAKHMARVFVAYTTTNLVAALVESGFDALRDDDDEEMDGAEFMKLYFENFATNQSILAKIPWLKEAVSIFQGFSSTRMDTQWIQTFSNTLKQVAKLMQGEGSPTKLIKNGLQTISYAFGLPFYNAYRDFMAILNKLDILTAEELDEILGDFN